MINGEKKNIYEKENTVIDRRESFHLFFVIERIKFFFYYENKSVTHTETPIMSRY